MLDDDERIDAKWKGEQTQLQITENCRPERLLWVYQKPKLPPMYRPTRKGPLIAMRRAKEDDPKQMLWEFRQNI